MVRFCSGMADTGSVALVAELTPEGVMPVNGLALMELPSAAAATVIKADRTMARKRDIGNKATDPADAGKDNSE